MSNNRHLNRQTIGLEGLGKDLLFSKNLLLLSPCSNVQKVEAIFQSCFLTTKDRGKKIRCPKKLPQRPLRETLLGLSR